MSGAEKVIFGMLGVGFSALLVGIGAMGLYQVIGTYNERQECVKLGIPLYRCQADSIQADVKVGK